MKDKMRKIKELKAREVNREMTGSNRPTPTRLMPRRRGPLDLAVATRRQTPEEQRQFNAALDVFLAEMVRQHL